MSDSKLTTLAHLRTGLEATKSYIDSQDAVLAGQIADVVADIEGIVATGGEANILEGFKVNGNTLPITDKIAELIVAAGTENGTINVNGAAIAITGLKNLAYLDKISEDEFSDSLKASFAALATNADLTALEIRVTTAEGEITTIKGRADALEAAVEALENAGYQTAAQVETIAKAAVAASGHAKFVEAESDPTVEGFAAEENVMYLWPAADGDGYVIYALVGGEMKQLGHTKVKLTDYSTTEQMQAAIDAAVEGIKIGDYAKLADLNAAVDRISALETALGNVYTKEEAEAKFTDEGEAQTIAETAAASAIAANTASDEEVDNMLGVVFTGNV